MAITRTTRNALGTKAMKMQRTFSRSSAKVRVSAPTDHACARRRGAVTFAVAVGLLLALAPGALHAQQWPSESIFSFGRNHRGQLGQNTLNLVPNPTPVGVVGPFAQDFLCAVETWSGGDHALALDGTGLVWAWGDNQRGQLGQGATSTGAQPFPVAVPPPMGFVRFSTAAAGSGWDLGTTSWSVAVETGNGAVWSWGSNAHGQLGTGTAGPPQGVPTRSALPATSGALAVAASKGGTGRGHTVAAVMGNQVATWGDNSIGQLGYATPPAPADFSATPTIVPGLPLVPFIDVGASGRSTFAVTSAGVVYAWGGNLTGVLGRGFASFSEPTPAPVVDPFNPSQPLSGITKIAPGEQHVLALDTSGRMYGWGNNNYLAVGVPAVPPLVFTRPVPLTLPPPYNPSTNPVVDIAAGDGHSLAVLQDGTVLSWGFNDHGELGRGTASAPLLPGPALVSNITSVSAGGRIKGFSLAVINPCP